MKWLKPKYSVCKECSVHFEPATGYEARWGDLCSTHRKPVQKRDEKRDEVIRWATTNWERLSQMMDKEVAEEKTACRNMLRTNLEGLAQHQNYQGQQGVLGGLGAAMLATTNWR